VSNFREGISRTLNSGLQDGPEDTERAVDRLRALSTAPRLATLLFRLFYDNDSTVLDQAIAELSRVAQKPSKLVEMALHEAMAPNCRRCNGARELIIGERRIVCSSCEGTGLHRYTNNWRASYLRCSVSEAKRHGAAMQHIHDVIGTYDRLCNAAMSFKLER